MTCYECQSQTKTVSADDGMCHKIIARAKLSSAYYNKKCNLSVFGTKFNMMLIKTKVKNICTKTVSMPKFIVYFNIFTKGEKIRLLKIR